MKLSYLKLLILLAIAMLSLNIYSISVAGLVLDEEGNPLENVFIIAENSFTMTDESGKFSLSNLKADELIKFHRIGYTSLEIKAGRNAVIRMQKESIDIEPLRVVEERYLPFESSAGKKVIIITPELRTKSLPEIIKSYPELDIIGVPLTGERQTISLQGHQSKHLIVMIDGIPLNRAGQPLDISQIPLGNAESIEIISGGGSAYGGSGAIAGIININTGSAFNEYSLSQSIGSFQTYRTTTILNTGWKSFRLNSFMERSSAANDFSFYDSQNKKKIRENNDKEQLHLQAKLSYSFKLFRLQYDIRHQEFNNKLPGPTNTEILYRDARLTGKNQYHSFSFSYPFTQFFFDAKAYLQKGVTYYDNTRTPHPMFRIYAQHIDGKRGGELKVARKSENYVGDLVFEYQREDFEYKEKTKAKNSIPNVFSEKYALRSSFKLISGFYYGDWTNSAALRYDFSNKWKDKISGKYESSFQLFLPLSPTLEASAGNNYALPSFYDLYWRGDSQVSGNPSLQAEESLNYMLGITLKLPLTKVSLSYDEAKVSNLIYWHRSVTGWKPANIADATVRNLNFSANLNFSSLLTATASYTTVQALNKTRNPDGTLSYLYNKKLIYTPESKFSGSVTLNYYSQLPVLSSAHLTFTHNYNGRQWSTPDQLIPPLKPYNLSGLEMKIRKNNTENELGYELSFMLNNLFSTRYEIYQYIPQPGLNWLLNFSIFY